MNPWKVRKIKWNGEPAELMTFTGTTEAEYDSFLDARFEDGKEPIGFRRDSAAEAKFLLDEHGQKCTCLHWMQFRRYTTP